MSVGCKNLKLTFSNEKTEVDLGLLQHKMERFVIVVNG